MARKKNATFQGATPFDVDVDALTLQRTIENAIGDTALVYDMLTGENAEANTVRHIGGGRGCPLGIPLWQQHIGRSLNYTGIGTAKGGVPGDVWVVAHPFFVPEGETSVRVRVYAEGPFDTLRPHVLMTSTAGVKVARPSLERLDDRNVYECDVSGLSTGVYLVFLCCDLLDNSTQNVDLISWHGVFPRKRETNVAPMRANSGAVVGVTTPAATEGVAHVSFDAGLFGNQFAFDAYLTSYLNRNLNGLEEYGSGWPAGGNASYTHVDHDGAGAPDSSDPARSRFHACTRSLYAAEPELDFPWLAEGLGAYGSDGLPVIDPSASAPTAGMLSWFAPFPLSATSTTYWQVPAITPDFQATSSRLKFAILAAGDASPINWQVTVNAGGATTTSNFGALFAADGSATCLTLATGSAVAFTGDAFATVTAAISKATAFSATYTEFFLLGCCLYWEP
jgi:hypothetical protein